MKKSFRNQVTSAVMGLAAVFGGTPPASAAIVTGSWDPQFSAPLSNLGWEATINFSVPDACMTSAPGLKINLAGHSFNCGTLNPRLAPPAITILRAQIGIYLWSDPTHALIDVLTFDNASLPLSAVRISASDELTYFLALGHSNAVRGTVAGVDDGYDFRMVLNQPAGSLFGIPLVRGVTYPNIEFAGTGTSNFTRSTNPPTETAFRQASDQNLARELAATELVVTSVVPEPSALALVGLALAAAAAARRRRG